MADSPEPQPSEAPESDVPKSKSEPPKASGAVERFLSWIERVGNKLPDPAILFAILMLVTWVLSALLAKVQFTEIHPAHGRADPHCRTS